MPDFPPFLPKPMIPTIQKQHDSFNWLIGTAMGSVVLFIVIFYAPQRSYRAKNLYSLVKWDITI
jgi:hypothetical protein